MERVKTYCRKHQQWILWIAFPLLSLAMHSFLFDLPIQGIHAWRQCETASNIVQFAEGDANILNPHVYSLEWQGGLKRMEFPVMQWVMGMTMRVTGDHVWVIRILSWLIGFVTVVGFYRLIFTLFKDKFLALAGAWCWIFSPVIFYYSINPLPDNLSLMAAVWGVAWYLEWHNHSKAWALLLSFAFISLATATKLPFVVFSALPFGGLLAALFRERGRNIVKVGVLTILGSLLLAPALYWYAWVIPQWTGNGVVKGILDSTGEDIPLIVRSIGENIYSTLPELLVNYASVPFLLVGIFQILRKRLYRHPLAFPFGLLALGVVAYFIFEINMITSVHDYYLFPFLPGTFILIIIGLRHFAVFKTEMVKLLAIVLLAILPVTAGLRAYGRWSEKGMPAGLLKNIEVLQKASPANARIVFGNDLSPHISLFHLRHFGWTFDVSNFDPVKFEDWIQKEAKFFYSTSREHETNAVIQPHLGELVGEWDGIRVWKLK
ncbi:MAG: hypothetical protein RLZZ519_841 [Bacteroidota bacterium]|jgi:hypothetical protein